MRKVGSAWGSTVYLYGHFSHLLIFATAVLRPMFYDSTPMLILALATGYLLAVYLVLRLGAQYYRSRRFPKELPVGEGTQPLAASPPRSLSWRSFKQILRPHDRRG